MDIQLYIFSSIIHLDPHEAAAVSSIDTSYKCNPKSMTFVLEASFCEIDWHVNYGPIFFFAIKFPMKQLVS